MSDSKLHLMSFAPVPDTKTTVHVVGLPDSLRDALFTLMPPRKEGGYLNTKVLKDDLRCWLDRAVELNPVRPNVHTDSWLIALAPIDLAKLCNVIAVWISSRKDIDTQSPAYRKVMGMLHPETFEEAVRGEEICLFSGDGRPTGRLTFPAFSAQVADAIADIPLELANGMCGLCQIRAEVWLEKLDELSDEGLSAYIGRYQAGWLDPFEGYGL